MMYRTLLTVVVLGGVGCAAWAGGNGKEKPIDDDFPPCKDGGRGPAIGEGPWTVKKKVGQATEVPIGEVGAYAFNNDAWTEVFRKQVGAWQFLSPTVSWIVTVDSSPTGAAVNCMQTGSKCQKFGVTKTAGGNVQNPVDNPSAPGVPSLTYHALGRYEVTANVYPANDASATPTPYIATLQIVDAGAGLRTTFFCAQPGFAWPEHDNA